MKVHWQIIIALVLGVAAGSALQYFLGAGAAGSRWVLICEFLGKTVFIGLLKMIIVPLIFSSIVTGIAGLSGISGFGRLGIKTLGYYVLSSVLAITIGLSAVNVMKPGLVDGKPNPEVASFIENNSKKFEKKGNAVNDDATGLREETHPLGVVGNLVERMIPVNIFKAASDNGAMLSLIFISLLTAFGLIAIDGPGKEAVVNVVGGVNQLMIKITGWIMRLAPLGVFGLMSSTIAQTGPSFLLAMASYMVTVLMALALHFFVALPLLLIFLGRVNPLRHFRAMRDALLTSFSTASSSATLPVTMRCLQDNAGVSKRTSSFVLPLGATVNMDGTALYECIAVLFVAQVMGASLDFAAQLSVVVLALLTSVGVAGVPSASLVAIVIIIQNVAEDQPWGGGAMAAVGAIYAVDRILDMCRTSVNIFSDSCGAVIIARSEGEKGVLAGDEIDSSSSKAKE
ncbi:MAG: dicarboxylate/amino acid:cation symporter [Verrucomicrobiaceae bacterium]|nr:dicarboxylate/amino acid:cation symporter [Verrucomicrobiaceae bacterium]